MNSLYFKLRKVYYKTTENEIIKEVPLKFAVPVLALK